MDQWREKQEIAGERKIWYHADEINHVARTRRYVGLWGDPLLPLADGLPRRR